jgi:hypothetical protein
MMNIAIDRRHAFYLDADDQPHSFPIHRFDRLWRGEPDATMSAFAGQRVRFAVFHTERSPRRPASCSSTTRCSRSTPMVVSTSPRSRRGSTPRSTTSRPTTTCPCPLLRPMPTTIQPPPAIPTTPRTAACSPRSHHQRASARACARTRCPRRPRSLVPEPRTVEPVFGHAMASDHEAG